MYLNNTQLKKKICARSSYDAFQANYIEREIWRSQREQCDTSPSILADNCHRFCGICYFPICVARIKMKAASCLETLLFIYRSIQHHILVDRETNCAVYISSRTASPLFSLTLMFLVIYDTDTGWVYIY